MNDRFEFGENWKSFLRNVDESHIEEAIADVRDVYDIEHMENSRFLDIGCGSGMFSLAAHRLGAAEVVSLDYDEQAVECCRQLRDEEEEVGNWSVTQGDILDEDFVRSLGDFDYVYCWGVAHHTGDLWKAVDNTVTTVAERGQLCLGIYNRVEEGVYDSHTALKIKRLYNWLPDPLRKLMVYGYAGAHLSLRTVLKREDPIKYVNSYGDDNRGMDYWHDVKDWLGGLPFEFASPEEVEDYFDTNHPSFDHRKTIVRGNRPETVNVYVFRNSP